MLRIKCVLLSQLQGGERETGHSKMGGEVIWMQMRDAIKWKYALTDGDFVFLPQHDVVGREVAVDYPLLLVQVPQRQAHLGERGEVISTII